MPKKRIVPICRRPLRGRKNGTHPCEIDLSLCEHDAGVFGQFECVFVHCHACVVSGTLVIPTRLSSTAPCAYQEAPRYAGGGGEIDLVLVPACERHTTHQQQ